MRRPELPALTGVRFYAALAVFLSHVSVIPGMDGLSEDRLPFNVGVVGVSFFFVLSGFILTYNYADLFSGGVPGRAWTRFVRDRWARIYPVHLATLLLALPIQIFSPNLPLDWRVVPFHALLIQCFWPWPKWTVFNYLNVPSWSISCEWFFYLLAPIAIYLVFGTIRRWILVAAVVLYAGGLGWLLSHGSSDFARLYLVSWFAPSRIPEFVVGVFAARAFLKRGGGISPSAAGLMRIAGILLVIGGAVYRKHAPWPLWGGLLYVPGSALLIPGLAKGSGVFARHLGHPWLKRLGAASFSFYLLQAPILRAARGVFLLSGLAVRSWVAFWAVAAVMFAIVQVSAFITHDRYEMPLQKWLRSPRRAAGAPMRSAYAANTGS